MRDVVQLTKELVAFNTVSANSNIGLCEFLTPVLFGMGFCVEDLHVKDYPADKKTGRPAVKKANLIARIGPKDAEPLVLCGHMDTMPIDDITKWDSKKTRDPLHAAENTDGNLYGRGTVDMKGPLAAMICAVESLLEKSPKLRRELIICLTHDEEVGLRGARRIVADNKLKNPRFILVTEPTQLVPVRMHKGYLCLTAICAGEGGHSARGRRKINAIEVAARVVEELEEFAKELKAVREPCMDPPYANLNIGLIAGGTKLNKIPAKCEVSFSIRPIPGQSTKRIQAYITERLMTLGFDRKTGVSVVNVELFERDKGRIPTEPMCTSADSELIKVAEKVSGRSAIGEPYSTDASVLQKLGADCMIFGPGNIDVAHEPNEFIELNQLKTGVEYFGKIVEAICVEG